MPPGRFRARAGKAEDAGPFEEERALFREQQRKARQIDLTRVHFGLAEVGIERRRQPQARRDAVEEIEAGLAGEVVFPSRDTEPPAGEKWTEIEPDALREAVEVRDLSGFGHLKELRVEPCARPAIVFELAIDRCAPR